MSRSKNSAYDSKDDLTPSLMGLTSTSRSSASPPVSASIDSYGIQKWEQLRREWRTCSGSYSTNPSATQRGYNTHYAAQQARLSRHNCEEDAKGTSSASYTVYRPEINTEDVIERLFSSNGNMTLPEPLPLGQMIEILTEVWETEGLYDS